MIPPAIEDNGTETDVPLATKLRVHLTFPDKLLWPNGPRGHPRAVDRAKKAYREEAGWAAIASLAAYGRPTIGEGEIPVNIVVHAKQFGPLPDKDNCVAAMKVALDAIAQQLGVNDRQFAAPTVEFAPNRVSAMVVEIPL